jgi:hypothetical protein
LHILGGRGRKRGGEKDLTERTRRKKGCGLRS